MHMHCWPPRRLSQIIGPQDLDGDRLAILWGQSRRSLVERAVETLWKEPQKPCVEWWKEMNDRH